MGEDGQGRNIKKRIVINMDLKKYIRDVPNFPKKGIIFKDITPLLADKKAFQHAVKLVCDFAKKKKIETILGIDSRGFIFGGAVAYNLGLKFVPVRKCGKLPCKTISENYDLEYGASSVEIHEDSLHKGERVLIIDDLLATGGTAQAACRLVEKLGAQICGIAFIIELGFLKGCEKLKNYEILSLIEY